MPYGSTGGATTRSTNGETTTRGLTKKVNEYKISQKVGYGTTAVDSGAFEPLYQTGAGYPLLIEDLKNITIKNTGIVAIELRFTLNEWDDDGPPDSDSGTTRYTSQILAVGDYMYLPSIKMLVFGAGGSSAGTAYGLDNKNPADITGGALYQVSGSTLGAALDDTDTTVTANATSHPFYVGDLIQIGTDTTTVTRQEIMRVTAISGATLTVERALYGTSKADKDSQTDATEGAVSGARIHLPFFNTTGNSNHYNGLSTCQTNANGIFHIYNFFGYGRYTSNIAGGIVPGTLSGKFFNSGHQSLGLSGITASTNSGLTASGEYKLDITVDGGTLFQDLTFTLDSSNVNFGGTNGVISKIQSALDTQYYTAGNLFEKKVTVGIVNGDIRFTSGSHLSTSAILLADTGDAGSFIDATANGRIPPAGELEDPVEARLPNDITLNKVSGVEEKNVGAFFYDDGLGNITGAAKGNISYNTGEFHLTSAPVNAHFVISANYGSSLSGGTKLNVNGANSIMKIEARSINYKIDGNIEFTAYE